MKSFFLIISVNLFSVNLFCHLSSAAQKTASPVSKWRAVIHRQDENNIVFNFEEQQKNKQTILYILNAGERLRVDSVRFTADSVFIKMPVFESSFKAKITGNKWSGLWTRGTSGAEQVMPFTAEKNNKRFELTEGQAKRI